jgi:hypothetical protein
MTSHESHENAEPTPPTILVRVQEPPAGEAGSVLCRAVTIDTPLVAEGAAVSLTEAGDAFPVAHAEAEPPGAGEYVVAERSGGSWTIAPRGRGA